MCSKFTGEPHFGMGALLEICCIFSEHLFLKPRLHVYIYILIRILWMQWRLIFPIAIFCCRLRYYVFWFNAGDCKQVSLSFMISAKWHVAIFNYSWHLPFLNVPCSPFQNNETLESWHTPFFCINNPILSLPLKLFKLFWKIVPRNWLAIVY